MVDAKDIFNDGAKAEPVNDSEFRAAKTEVETHREQMKQNEIKSLEDATKRLEAAEQVLLGVLDVLKAAAPIWYSALTARTASSTKEANGVQSMLDALKAKLACASDGSC